MNVREYRMGSTNVNQEKLVTKDIQDIGQMTVREYRMGNKKGQSRETGNIGFIIHRTNKC
jgi:hypothetical protein